ncbi:glycosyltransferase family 2 protein [Neorhizobium petrolearium]|uniref:glycosyltransferase family 2 protein n=1 Tax=Neorhizobium petrolearium TaxID=515361 RepID=UPI003F5CDFA7
MIASIETRKIRSRRAKQGESVAMAPFAQRTVRPLVEADIPLILLCHNDRKFLPSLLAHYRRLGVTRFICLDDQSSDGSLELLVGEPDVDVWVSPVRYRDAKRGKLWREGLFARYGHNRWYLNIDADEYLVYPDCFQRPLPDLIKTLEARGDKRLAAPMIDLYPGGEVDAFAFDGRDETMPWEVATHLDGEGYRMTYAKRYMSVEGGPRYRTFAADAELMKYPLLYWDERCSFGVSIHQPTPFEWNFVPVGGVLLHFKFFADYKEKSQEAVADQQYFDGAREYKKILEVGSRATPLSFMGPNSIRYQSPDQMRELGFVVDVFNN